MPLGGEGASPQLSPKQQGPPFGGVASRRPTSPGLYSHDVGTHGSDAACGKDSPVSAPSRLDFRPKIDSARLLLLPT